MVPPVGIPRSFSTFVIERRFRMSARTIANLVAAFMCAAALPASASIPAPADFDGDGRADISRLTNTGVWEVDLSSNGFGHRDLILGGYPSTAIPVPADYDGDGLADLSVKGDDGKWYIDYAFDGF